MGSLTPSGPTSRSRTRHARTNWSREGSARAASRGESVPPANQLAAEGKRLILAPAGVERGAQVDELELDGALGAELVHLQIERRVHAHARAHAALVGGDGEENAVEIHAAFL